MFWEYKHCQCNIKLMKMCISSPMKCLNMSRPFFCFFSLFCWFVSLHYPKYFQQHSIRICHFIQQGSPVGCNFSKISESEFSYLNFLHWMCIIVIISRRVFFFFFLSKNSCMHSVWKAVLQIKKINKLLSWPFVPLHLIFSLTYYKTNQEIWTCEHYLLWNEN